MTSNTVYVITIFSGALFGIAALVWMHLRGMPMARSARKRQRDADRRAFVTLYRNTAQTLIQWHPLVCYYNERVNKKEVRLWPRYEPLPKLCWIRDGDHVLKMETSLAVQWAVEFAALRVALIGGLCKALELELWPIDPNADKRLISCGPALACIADWLYCLVQPRALYQPSQKQQLH